MVGSNNLEILQTSFKIWTLKTVHILILQVSLNEISYGLAFHPHFATDAPSPPYDNAGNLDAIRHMVKMEKKSFSSDFDDFVIDA